MGTSDDNYNAKQDNDDGDDPYYSNTSLPQEYYFGEQ
jgi:hypothetical protein